METIFEALKKSCTYESFERVKNMDEALKSFKFNFHCI